MSVQPISYHTKGVNPKYYHSCVAASLFENMTKMNKDMFVALFDNLGETIRELDVLLTNVQVRTHGDPRMSRPTIGEKPTLKQLLKRLEHQMDNAITLSNECFLGPPANEVEEETMAGVDTIMERLHDRTMPDVSEEAQQATSSSGQQSTSS